MLEKAKSERLALTILFEVLCPMRKANPKRHSPEEVLPRDMHAGMYIHAGSLLSLNFERLNQPYRILTG